MRDNQQPNQPKRTKQRLPLTTKSPVARLEPPAELEIALAALNIVTVGDLLALSVKDAFRTPGVGRARLRQVTALAEAAREMLGLAREFAPEVPPPIGRPSDLAARLERTGAALDRPWSLALFRLPERIHNLLEPANIPTLRDLLRAVAQDQLIKIEGFSSATADLIMQELEAVAAVGPDVRRYGPGGLPRTPAALLDRIVETVDPQLQDQARALLTSGLSFAAFQQTSSARTGTYLPTLELNALKRHVQQARKVFLPLAQEFARPLLSAAGPGSLIHESVAAALAGEPDPGPVIAAISLADETAKIQRHSSGILTDDPGAIVNARESLKLSLMAQHPGRIDIRRLLVEHRWFLPQSADPATLWHLASLDFALIQPDAKPHVVYVLRHLAEGLERHVIGLGGTATAQQLLQEPRRTFALKSTAGLSPWENFEFIRKPLAQMELELLLWSSPRLFRTPGGMIYHTDRSGLTAEQIDGITAQISAQLEESGKPALSQRLLEMASGLKLKGGRLTELLPQAVRRRQEIVQTTSGFVHAIPYYNMPTLLDDVLSQARRPVSATELLQATVSKTGRFLPPTYIFRLLRQNPNVLDLNDGTFIHESALPLAADQRAALLDQMFQQLPLWRTPIPAAELAGAADTQGHNMCAALRSLCRRDPRFDCRPDGTIARSADL